MSNEGVLPTVIVSDEFAQRTGATVETKVLTPSLRVNLGPLTTTFTPPESCDTPMTQTGDDVPEMRLAQSCITGRTLDDPSCWPLPLNNVYGTNPLNGYGIYSPGYICPFGFTSACSQSVGTLSDRTATLRSFLFQYPLTGAEHGVGCCPSGYSCTYINIDDYLIQTCRAAPYSFSYSAIICDADPGNSFILDGNPITVHTPSYNTSVPLQTTEISFKSGLADYTMFAPLIQLVYQASDLPGFHSPYLSSSLTKYGSSTINSTESNPIATDVHSTSGSRIAGIVIGALSGLSYLIVLVWFSLWWRRRKRRKGSSDSSAVREWPKAELSGLGKQLCEVGGENIRRELPNETAVHELPNETGAHELPKDTAVYELHGDTIVHAVSSSVLAGSE
ncbi:hypothetical protein EV356DRAFT_499639 [Viridothelium virens]|uniref:Uncharacterized protein n=1 Tax=Viridothelium virens TaxID=1048519 RepID=A0A6A6HNR9_VIRVR|nr:hypothetical protein EV356DRAFT_499639 [Viridothelium virens]